MFDRISGNLTGGSGDGDADAGELSDLLGDDEELVHVLANDGDLEHTESGRTTTVEPSGDARAFVLVTDERVLYVFGNQPDEPEIEIAFTDLKASHHRKGLLSSKLQVKTDDESVLFGPDEGDTEAAAEYVDRVGSCWADMETALGKARRAVSEFEERCRDGTATGDKYLAAKSNLSEAKRCATRNGDAPSGKMRDHIDEVRTELERRHVTAWLDRAVDRLDAVETALEENRHDDACQAYADTVEALSEARDAIEDADDVADGASARREKLETELREAGEGFLSETDATLERALNAEETSVAVDAWEDAFDRYNAAVEAGWNGHAPVSGETLELQLTWVTASLLDALGSHATMLETRGDDADDDETARKQYEEAMEWFERAEEFAGEHPERSPDEFADAADRVEEKQLERSGWEFGNA